MTSFCTGGIAGHAHGYLNRLLQIILQESTEAPDPDCPRDPPTRETPVRHPLYPMCIRASARLGGILTERH